MELHTINLVYGRSPVPYCQIESAGASAPGPGLEIFRATKASDVSKTALNESGWIADLGWRPSISGLRGIGKISVSTRSKVLLGMGLDGLECVLFSACILEKEALCPDEPCACEIEGGMGF